MSELFNIYLRRWIPSFKENLDFHCNFLHLLTFILNVLKTLLILSNSCVQHYTKDADGLCTRLIKPKLMEGTVAAQDEFSRSKLITPLCRDTGTKAHEDILLGLFLYTARLPSQTLSLVHTHTHTHAL